MDTNQNLLTNDLQIDAVAYSHLKETAMWAKFLAIVGFVVSVLLIVLAIFAGAFLNTMSETTAPMPGMMAGLMSGIYVVAGVVYFLISLYLYKFAVKMKQALVATDQEQLNSSLLNLKYVYRILGIIMIIYL